MGVRMEQQPLQSSVEDSGPFYHGTKAELTTGGVLVPGYSSNFGEQKKANFVYLTATLDAAIWGAELAVGEAPAGSIRWSPRVQKRTTPT